MNYFCIGCQEIRSSKHFFTKHSKTGKTGKTKLCDICIAAGMKFIDTKYKTCPVCEIDRMNFDFKGGKFEGDRYINKAYLCWHCREDFENIDKRWLKSQSFSHCYFCNEDKSNSKFDSNISDSELNFTRKSFVSKAYIFNACLDCRKTKKFEDFLLYKKRVFLAAAKLKSKLKNNS